MHPSSLLERILRRHPHAVFALAAIPCAYFAARGTSDATPPCGLPWKVFGAVLGDDPRWSFAMVREREGADATPLRVGATLAGHAVLAVSSCHGAGAWVAVRPAMGARCYVAERMPAVAAPPEPTRAIPLPEPAVTGVERVGERAWEVRGDTGLELTSPDGMLEAWVRLRTSDRLRGLRQGDRPRRRRPHARRRGAVRGYTAGAAPSRSSFAS